MVSAGTGSGGKRKKYTKTVKVKSDREAEKELVKFVAKVKSSTYIEPSKLTLKSFSEKWLIDYAKPKLAPKTIYEYERLLELRIIPALGHLNLSKIKPIHLVEFYSNLQEEGIRIDGRGKKLSNNTILHYHRFIKNILETAVKWQLISSNPANNVQPPKVKKKEADFYNEEEIKQLITCLENEELKYKVAILVTITAGLRLGELMGLKWNNVDFNTNTIEIVQANQYIPKNGVFSKDPKTETSKRIISLPNPVIDILKQYKIEQTEKRLQCGDMWTDTEYILTQWNGLPMHPNTPSTWFSKFLKKHELRKITFHQLRHTSATMLINAGLNIKALSARLGHSNTSTTLNIYSHALKSADKVAADRIGDIIFKDKKIK
ncbi:tyrosine-type recombinase/integrase [Inediibacterium massiliense]|uniref:tyrosine-type recombinase/integrase n=1 Tax=Inediibacterium massiliense TaxID=1658111 RepID=UPI0006B41A2A|nr:site-specific integrase [Inediibacterium massiliense]